MDLLLHYSRSSVRQKYHALLRLPFVRGIAASSSCPNNSRNNKNKAQRCHMFFPCRFAFHLAVTSNIISCCILLWCSCSYIRQKNSVVLFSSCCAFRVMQEIKHLQDCVWNRLLCCYEIAVGVYANCQVFQHTFSPRTETFVLVLPICPLLHPCYDFALGRHFVLCFA